MHLNQAKAHRIEVLGILQGIKWPVQFHEFDPPQPHLEDNISQLLPSTVDVS